MRLSGAGLGILKGMGITFKNFLRPPITVQYPEQKLVMSRRIRGNEVLWYEGRCTGCATCAKACPQGNIEISTTPGPENNRIVDVFRVDTGRCMFCGLCVESCPYDALFLGRNYERTKYRRADLVSNKEDVRMGGERQPSGYARPAIESGLPRQSLLVDWDKPDKDGGQHLDWLPLKRRKGGAK